MISPPLLVGGFNPLNKTSQNRNLPQSSGENKSDLNPPHTSKNVVFLDALLPFHLQLFSKNAQRSGRTKDELQRGSRKNRVVQENAKYPHEGGPLNTSYEVKQPLLGCPRKLVNG